MVEVLKIREGSIVLSGDPYLIHKSEGCTIWEVDCKSKYAEHTLGIEDNIVELMLYPDENTLRVGPGSAPTTIEFVGTEDYHVVSEGGRYTYRVMFYKRGFGLPQE